MGFLAPLSCTKEFPNKFGTHFSNFRFVLLIHGEKTITCYQAFFFFGEKGKNNFSPRLPSKREEGPPDRRLRRQ